MNFPQPYTLKQIANILQCFYVGDSDFLITGCNEIHRVVAGNIVFVDHPKYYDKALQSAATVVLINKEVDCPQGKALLISEDPFRDFNILTSFFKPFQKAETYVAPSAKIGNNVVLQPGVFIGNNVVIGDNTVIHANVSIYDSTEIGTNVVVQANTVLGSDAFYYKNRPEGFDQLLSSGIVKIEDNVHVGSSCTIDRGVSAITHLKQGTKIDNQVHVGHDTIIGEKCLIASQTGIAGCVEIGNEVTIWGQVGITSGITIGDKVVISAKSGVSKSLAANKHYFGIPADDFRSKYKEIAAIRQIPELIEKVKNLQ